MKFELILGILFLLSQAIAAIYAKKKQLEKQRRLEEMKWQRNGDGTAVETPDAEDSDLYDLLEDDDDEEEEREEARRRERAAQPPPPVPTQQPQTASTSTGVRFPNQVPGQGGGMGPGGGTPPVSFPIPIPLPIPMPRPVPAPPTGQPGGPPLGPGAGPGRGQRRGDVADRQPRAQRSGFMEARSKRGPSERDRLKAQRIAERAASRAARARARQARGDRGSVAAKTAQATRKALQAAAAEAHRRDELRTGHASEVAHAAALGVSTAAAVRKTLGDPQSVRVAFVTAEILRPPHAG